MPPESIDFLNVEDVMMIHDDTLAHEGGLGGVRDAGLLESAVLMPRQRFAGQLLHPDLASMAGAYLFHLASNHPFHDGNKRTAAMSTLVFLDNNGITSLPSENDMESITMAVAAGNKTKDEITEWFGGVIGSS